MSEKYGCEPKLVSTSACHAAGRGSIRGPGVLGLYIIMCKNLALNIRDCLSLCLLEETLKAVGPFYLVSISPRVAPMGTGPGPGEVKDPTQKCVPCRGLHILAPSLEKDNSPINPLLCNCVLAQRWAVCSMHN